MGVGYGISSNGFRISENALGSHPIIHDLFRTRE